MRQEGRREVGVTWTLDRWQAGQSDRDRWLVQVVCAVLDLVVLFRHPKTWRYYRKGH